VAAGAARESLTDAPCGHCYRDRHLSHGPLRLSMQCQHLTILDASPSHATKSTWQGRWDHTHGEGGSVVVKKESATGTRMKPDRPASVGPLRTFDESVLAAVSSPRDPPIVHRKTGVIAT
jgi:hypothetical protein